MRDTVAALPGPLAELVTGLWDFAESAGVALRQFIGWAQGIVSTITALPGQALAALGNVGSLLVESGRALIGGFLSGIESMWGRITSTVGGIMDFVAGFFPSSPAKHGAFSGSGWTRISRGGGALASEFIGGFQRAANGFDTAFAGIASGIASSLDVNLTRPDFAPAAGTAAAAANEPTTVNNISVVQNNPVTRDPIKELRKASEDIMTGVWS